MTGKAVGMDDDDDGDFRVNFVPPESDLGSESSAGLESRGESTRSNSLESGVTVESPRRISSDSCGDSETRPDECSGWTDEKHNSYLDYLEKSFVRQLFSLMGGKTQRSSRNHHLPANSCKPIDQFAVLRDGCWQKIDSCQKAFSGTPVRKPVGHECSTEIAAEASDQNFTDESTAEKPSSSSSSHSPVCKRRRRDSEPNCSANDQVLPLGTSKQKGVSSGRQYG